MHECINVQMNIRCECVRCVICITCMNVINYMNILYMCMCKYINLVTVSNPIIV